MLADLFDAFVILTVLWGLKVFGQVIQEGRKARAWEKAMKLKFKREDTA